MSISEMSDHRSNDNKEQIPAFKHNESPYQLAYEAGLASGREAGYQRGYREGFSDGLKLGIPANGAAGSADKPSALSKKSTDKRTVRLRCLPCANCGCALYTDEIQCSCCGTPKTPADAKDSQD
jgi:hypothetical protein